MVGEDVGFDVLARLRRWFCGLANLFCGFVDSFMRVFNYLVLM